MFERAKTTTHVRGILGLKSIQSAESIMYRLVKKGLAEKVAKDHPPVNDYGVYGVVRAQSVIYRPTPAGVAKAAEISQDP